MTATLTTSPPAAGCCDEYGRALRLSRRGLLAGASALAGAATLFGSAEVRASAASARLAPASSVLVVLSLRGAADGLSLVVPHADPVYYAARPRLAVPADRLLAKDGMFGLHPALAPLLPLWTAGRMAAVHATGLPIPNRSHFAAMEEVEDAGAGSATRVGWLNRLVGLDALTSPLQGVALGTPVAPTSLYGPAPTMSAGSPDDVSIAGEDEWDHDGGRRRSLATLWGGDRSPLGQSARDTFAAVDGFAPARQASDAPANGASYPGGDLGAALAHAARVIRADVGVQVLTVDQGDWDHHQGLGTVEWGRMLDNAGTFASAVAAFFTDLGAFGDKVTLVVLSEFGRRVQENANYGLDHGYGNAMFVAGAGVTGGYYAAWPGLANTPDADLLVTTDYRAVLTEVVRARFAVDASQVFPGFAGAGPGLMRPSGT